jgi:aspartyl-tRNA(Asn)/glutamyl-tRNA(Gln) amidotransferase subunit A
MHNINIHPFVTIQELRSLIEKKQITKQEVLRFFLDRFKKHDQEIGSALEIFDQDSINSCVDGVNDAGILAGIPGLIKDNICQKGRVTSCASNILKDYVAVYDATVIERLKSQGSFLVGRANCDEFAMGSSTEYSAFKKTKNPWDLTKVPGGSSGGSAAAVAAGFVPFSLGSETGGSMRQPAALCGVVGLKPTYGLISRYGLVAYASSLDQIGICTRTVYDNALVLSSIAGYDKKDATSLSEKTKDYTATLDGTFPEKLTVGIVQSALYADGMDPEIVKAIEVAISYLQSQGITIKKVEIPSLQYAAATYFIISRAEAASNLARFDGIRYGTREKGIHDLKELYLQNRTLGFGSEVKARIMIGNYVLSAGHADEFYQHAKYAQQRLQHDFKEVFIEVDTLLFPTHPIPAFSFDAFADNKLQMDLQDYFTCGANLAKIPALSVPCGFTTAGLPIGMQFMGPRCSESLLYKIGHAYQQETNWHLQVPTAYKI